MTAQTVGAVVIVAVAAAWLVRRFWRRGFDDDAHGCSSCHVDPKPLNVTGLSHGAAPRERPEGDVRDPGARDGARTRDP